MLVVLNVLGLESRSIASNVCTVVPSAKGIPKELAPSVKQKYCVTKLRHTIHRSLLVYKSLYVQNQ